MACACGSLTLVGRGKKDVRATEWDPSGRVWALEYHETRGATRGLVGVLSPCRDLLVNPHS